MVSSPPGAPLDAIFANIPFVSVSFYGRYFILWDIVDSRTEPNPKPNPNPNPDPNCGFTLSHKMKYLRFLLS